MDDLAPADPAAAWMTHLERAHDLAHVAARAIEDHAEPSEHVAPAARRLELGLGALYDAFDGRADRATAMNVAGARLWDAAVLLARAGLSGALEALRGACAELVAAEERLPRVPIAPRPADVLVASTDVPALHVVERPSLVPSLRAPPIPEPEKPQDALALPEPKTFEELTALADAMQKRARESMPKPAAPVVVRPRKAPAPEEPPAGFAFAPPPPMDDDTFVRRWARECFLEIGMLGIQRAPLPGDDWRACQALDRRLVIALDALVALGPVAIAYFEPLALDAPAVDPIRMFAAAMVGGSLEGRDALACAERVLYRFGPTDPVIGPAFTAAMKLAPSPFVPAAMRSLLRSATPGCRAIAADVLANREWLDEGELGELAETEDPAVLAIALSALAAARHRDLDRAVARALGRPEPAVQSAALDAMALAAHADAASAARAAVSGPLGDRALVPLALVADEEDAQWLLRRMRGAPTEAAIEAVGWAGLVDAVPALIDLLASEDEAVALAAGAALDRLLGANLVDTIAIEAEALEPVVVVDPDPAPPPRRPALEALGDPRDRPPAPAKETLEVPSKDPARWRAYWAEHGRTFDRALRLRRGQPHGPSVSLYELDRLPLAAEDRRRLHRELAARTGRFTRFDPADFVVTQEASLEAWASLVGAMGEKPGSWDRPIRR